MSAPIALTQEQRDELFDEYDAAMKKGDLKADREIHKTRHLSWQDKET